MIYCKSVAIRVKLFRGACEMIVKLHRVVTSPHGKAYGLHETSPRHVIVHVLSDAPNGLMKLHAFKLNRQHLSSKLINFPCSESQYSKETYLRELRQMIT